MRALLRVLLVALLTEGMAFKFLSNFKAAQLIPRPSAMLKRRKATKQFGDKKLAVITGASSGVGLETTARLLRTGEYHVFGAVRDLDKMRAAANDLDFPMGDFTPLQVELDSFESVRGFCKDLEKAKLNKPIDRLICNAATYQPGGTPVWSADGQEQTMQVNFLSHYLMVSLLLPGMALAADPRIIMVGGARADEGVSVYPRADLGALEGLKPGSTAPLAMLDGSSYFGAKAYKDSKLCLGMTVDMLHRRYHKQTGITFSIVHPGSVTGSALLADKPPLDKSAALPAFVKTLADFELTTLKTFGIGDNLHADGLVTETSAVSTAEAAEHLFQVAYDVRCSTSGSWSWREGDAAAEAAAAAEDYDGARSGWEGIYENEPSGQLLNLELSQELWRESSRVTGAVWPPANVPKSPCPTLKVVGAVTKAMNAKEEAKRTLQGIKPVDQGIASALGGKALGSTGYVVDAIAGNTIGRVAKIAQDKLLGGLPTDAIEGTFQETKEKRTEAGASKLEQKVDDALLADGLPIPARSLGVRD